MYFFEKPAIHASTATRFLALAAWPKYKAQHTGQLWRVIVSQAGLWRGLSSCEFARLSSFFFWGLWFVYELVFLSIFLVFEPPTIPTLCCAELFLVPCVYNGWFLRKIGTIRILLSKQRTPLTRRQRHAHEYHKYELTKSLCIVFRWRVTLTHKLTFVTVQQRTDRGGVAI